MLARTTVYDDDDDDDDESRVTASAFFPLPLLACFDKVYVSSLIMVCCIIHTRSNSRSKLVLDTN